MNTIKVAKRTGVSKTGSSWEARAIEIQEDNVIFKGLIFQPRSNGVSDTENIAKQYTIK